MAAKDLLIDPAEYNLDRAIADLDEIRRYNPQRYEMEQLTAIVFECAQRHICVGYKEVTAQEFWVRGHMPGMPLMPGVIMCEAAAQLCSYYTQKHDMLGVKMVGFGGLEEVRFRDMVRPGERLVVVSKLLKVRRGAMIVAQFQGLIGDRLVVEGKIKGIPIPDEILATRKLAAAGASAAS